MIKIIKTNQYVFKILLEECKNNYYFEIIAFCKTDKTRSTITNLNLIISELIEPIIAFESYETTIQIDENVGNQLYNEAIKLFNDKDWIEWLNTKLEDDKLAGAWSS
jgi:hypothetical protein